MMTLNGDDFDLGACWDPSCLDYDRVESILDQFMGILDRILSSSE